MRSARNAPIARADQTAAICVNVVFGCPQVHPSRAKPPTAHRASDTNAALGCPTASAWKRPTSWASTKGRAQASTAVGTATADCDAAPTMNNPVNAPPKSADVIANDVSRVRPGRS